MINDCFLEEFRLGSLVPAFPQTPLLCFASRQTV